MAEEINVKITTDYDSDGADDAIKDAEKIEDLEPELVIEGDASGVVDAAEDATAAAEDLTGREWITEFKADTAQMKSELEGAQAKLRETAEKADDAKGHLDNIGKTSGPGIGTNAISDMLGPLGDASGAASEFGQSIEGLGEIATAAAAKVGINADAMAGAIGGIGVAVALAAAAWTYFKGQQEEARKKLKELTDGQKDFNKALKEGHIDDAAEDFVDLYDAAFKAAEQLGIPTKDVVEFVTGISDKLPGATKKVDDLTAAFATGSLESARTTFHNINGDLDDQASKLDIVKDALEPTAARMGDLASATDTAAQKADDLNTALDTMSGMLDIQRAAEDFDTDINTAMANTLMGVGNTREEIRGIEDDVLRAAEFTKQNPVVIAQTLQKVKDGDLQGVKKDVDSWYAQNPVSITAVINQEKLKQQMASAQGGLQAWIDRLTPGGNAASTTTNTTVNVNLPRGARHSDIARAMSTTSRRSGRRYANPVVHYASH